MADEQKKSSSGGSNRRRRRRPPRKKRRSNQVKSAESGAAPPAKSGGETESSRSSRRRRRRRKSRSQSTGSQGREEAVVQQGDMLKAKLPESIFVYTHVLRSSELDTYEFRPDPFLSRSRSLEDFRIDLSPLFPEDDGGDDRVFDAALHGPIVTSLAGSIEDEDDAEDETDGQDGALDDEDE